LAKSARSKKTGKTLLEKRRVKQEKRAAASAARRRKDAVRSAL
jgi:hypothetical protein